MINIIPKAALTLLLAVTTLSGFSQLENNKKRGCESCKPSTDYWGLTFNLTGLVDNISLGALDDVNGNESFLLRYYYNDNVVFRAGFGLNTFNNKTNNVDSVASAQVEYDSTFTKTDFFFAPGIEKHFTASDRLDPYLGANLSFGALGKSQIDTETRTTDTLGLARINTIEEVAGGFSFGVNLIAGFNYFFTPKLAVGAEYQFGFVSARDGGDRTKSTTVTPVSGSSTSTREVGSSALTSSGFRTNSTAGITLSYFFTRNAPPRAPRPPKPAGQGGNS